MNDLTEAFKELKSMQSTIEKMLPSTPDIVSVFAGMSDESLLQLREIINQILAQRGLGGLGEGQEVLQ